MVEDRTPSGPGSPHVEVVTESFVNDASNLFEGGKEHHLLDLATVVWVPMYHVAWQATRGGYV